MFYRAKGLTASKDLVTVNKIVPGGKAWNILTTSPTLLTSGFGKGTKTDDG